MASTNSFLLEGSNLQCTVTLPQNLSKAQLLDFPAFKNWFSNIQRALSLQKQQGHVFSAADLQYTLGKIDVQAVTFFGKRVGLVTINADIRNEKGLTLPGTVFLRGGSVGILVILEPEGDNPDKEQHAVLVVQPRPAAGSLAFAEIPAGMMDGSGNVTGKAIEELKEETGLDIAASDLKDMTKLAVSGRPKNGQTETPKFDEALAKAMYPSPGGCDESMFLMLCQKKLPKNKIEELRGKLTGVQKEGEHITVKIVPLKDLWMEGARDGKTSAALALYENLKKANKI